MMAETKRITMTSPSGSRVFIIVFLFYKMYVNRLFLLKMPQYRTYMTIVLRHSPSDLETFIYVDDTRWRHPYFRWYSQPLA